MVVPVSGLCHFEGNLTCNFSWNNLILRFHRNVIHIHEYSLCVCCLPTDTQILNKFPLCFKNPSNLYGFVLD